MFAHKMMTALGKKAPLTLIFRNATPKATLHDYVNDVYPNSPSLKKPMSKEEYIQSWFERHGVNISMKQLRDRSIRYLRPRNDLIIMSSVFGSKYYDKFLDTISLEERELVSPFFCDRGWVALSFNDKDEADAWEQHFKDVEAKCPKRKSGPFKYLMTRALELRVPIFADDLRVEPAMKRLYADMKSEYKSIGFEIEEDNDIPTAIIPQEKKKKKKKRSPSPQRIIEEEDIVEVKRPALVLRISRDLITQVRSVENIFEYDPYEESDLSINDTIL
jgi:hypothetical protein